MLLCAFGFALKILTLRKNSYHPAILQPKAMLLTLYFMAATWIQSWRLRTIYTKLSQFIQQNASIVFYNVSNEGNGELFEYRLRYCDVIIEVKSGMRLKTLFFHAGTSMPPVSSELCTNYAQARIADMIWHQDGQRGAALVPRQHINLGSWISFQPPPCLVPFELTAGDYVATATASETVFILLETDLQPGESNGNVLMVCVILILFL